mmetsp:Transcript_36634/g.59219  ORF Transcript_36634/g.59219 Transcript_36634/m.59219 type:complete len:137 (+) Transcript_36634:11-421(+)|eukprot:CAMPEP_0184369008 /NCGR_PEP_ID=MMETSP1089-20130417/162001_1 /TAXON_ID=38269 ORGANISM="Gloeochaete wittrockiana, Strain SAG46.84" /NCGR_SAMPLE_ID=MMETSP1089 /ASSEMBLY_ACC=CAM_ASM_000445 /LENGTH=136 /DNA_ID=CAMNT_0026711397 /DNA_START=11 /DNA_END=421 /DNA_ORIENTATION=+
MEEQSTEIIVGNDEKNEEQDEISAKVPENTRFQMELEFVQMLANPAYLNYLAQNRYLEDQAFLNYLRYLHYWKRPEYAKYLVYPEGLFFLDMLEDETFRKEIKNTQCMEFIHQQQFYHWVYYRNHRASESATGSTV